MIDSVAVGALHTFPLPCNWSLAATHVATHCCFHCFLNPIILTDTVIKEKTESRKNEPTNVFKLLQISGLSTAQNLKKCCLLSHKPNLRPTEERRCSLTCSVAFLLVCATVCSWPAFGYTNLFGLPMYIYLKLLTIVFYCYLFLFYWLAFFFKPYNVWRHESS